MPAHLRAKSSQTGGNTSDPVEVPAHYPVLRRKQLLTDGTAMEYLARGPHSEEGFVFLHGIGGTASSWHQFMEELPSSRMSIAWNAPGYGSSSNVVPDVPEVSDYVDRLDAFLEELSLRRIHLVGHSWGTLIASAFARRRQEKVLSVALVSPSVGMKRLEPAERAAIVQQRLIELKAGLPSWVKAGAPRLVAPNAPRSIVAKLEQVHPGLQMRGLEQATHMLASASPIAELAGVKKPIMVVYGTDDQITPVRLGELFTAGVPGVRLEVIADCGHVPHLEQTEHLKTLLESFWVNAKVGAIV